MRLKNHLILALVLAPALSSAALHQEPCDLNHYLKQRHLESKLPAYQTRAASIMFQFETAGLKFESVEGPYRKGATAATLKSFKLAYNPAELSRLGFLRNALGNQPFKFTKADLRFAGQTDTGWKEGAFLELNLKAPPGIFNRDKFGPILKISRNTGRVIVFPYPQDGFFGSLKTLLLKPRTLKELGIWSAKKCF